jgi:hypothetical protein
MYIFNISIMLMQLLLLLQCFGIVCMSVFFVSTRDRFLIGLWAVKSARK